MDEEDLDTWYEERKDWLTEQYNLQLRKADSKLKPEKRRVAHEKLKSAYELKLKKLQSDYEKKAEKIINGNLKKHFFNHRLNMILKYVRSKFKKE